MSSGSGLFPFGTVSIVSLQRKFKHLLFTVIRALLEISIVYVGFVVFCSHLSIHNLTKDLQYVFFGISTQIALFAVFFFTQNHVQMFNLAGFASVYTSSFYSYQKVLPTWCLCSFSCWLTDWRRTEDHVFLIGVMAVDSQTIILRKESVEFAEIPWAKQHAVKR